MRLTTFRAAVAAKKNVDLTKAPFTEFGAALRSPNDYNATQQLGTKMRNAGVDSVCFESARDPDSGTNIGLFNPVFARKTPYREMSKWHLEVSNSQAIVHAERAVFATTFARHVRTRTVRGGRQAFITSCLGFRATPHAIGCLRHV